MAEVGFIKTAHTCHWRIPDWSKLRPLTEYSSPPLYIDDLKWSIKLYKGRPKSPDMLSLFVKLHETTPGSLRGIRKKVQLILKVHNTNPSNYYNDFGVGKSKLITLLEEAATMTDWMEKGYILCGSVRHTKWGEDALAKLDALDAFLNQNQASLSVNLTVLKSEVDQISPVIAPGCSPFASLANSAEFSDVRLQVTESEDDSTVLQQQQTFYGHKNILSAMSPWFKALFTSGMRESFEDVVTVIGVNPEIFGRVLRYCYTFNCNIRSVRDAQDILAAADRFQVLNLREQALQYMRLQITNSNIWDIWSSANCYDCKKTMKACKDFASAYFETLIHEPAWLEARSSVIMMALKTIDEGKIPSEEEIYKAVLAWARHSSPEQLERMSSSSDGDNTATVMQYLADTDELVDDHPSFSSVNSAQDASSSNEHLQDETIETEIKDKADAYPVYRPLAAGREADLAVILSYVRFPLIRPAFLAQVVEQDPYVMELEGVHDLLFEAYRYHAVGDTGRGESFRCRPRRYVCEE